jgi:KDO2-lipid IV(A) lauroyltransferase
VDNLQRAFPEKNAAQIARIVRRMWDNLGRVVAEFAHLDSLDVYALGGPVEVVGGEYLDQLRDDGKPGLFFSAHLGNWELAPLAASQRGIHLHQIYRAANNPHLEWLYRRRRAVTESGLIPKGAKGARELLRVIKAGGHVGILVDQKMNDGIAIPFFGRPAMTAPALAQISLKYDCPAVPVRVERLDGGRGHFRITIYPPLKVEKTGDHQRDIIRLMTQVNGLLEAWIRERPEQWLWVHNRWPPEPPEPD